MVASCCLCWARPRHTVRLLGKSRSLDRVNSREYTELVVGEQPDLLTAMGNSLSLESPSHQDSAIVKSNSSASLKSSSSAKSSSSRRSKVTFTEHNPEVHMIPPKSPPKPKRSRGCGRAAADWPEESQAAFQFELGQQVELVSLEEVETSSSGRRSHHSRTPEDVHKVTVQWSPTLQTYSAVTVKYSEACEMLAMIETDPLAARAEQIINFFSPGRPC